MEEEEDDDDGDRGARTAAAALSPLADRPGAGDADRDDATEEEEDEEDEAFIAERRTCAVPGAAAVAVVAVVVAVFPFDLSARCIPGSSSDSDDAADEEDDDDCAKLNALTLAFVAVAAADAATAGVVFLAKKGGAGCDRGRPPTAPASSSSSSLSGTKARTRVAVVMGLPCVSAVRWRCRELPRCASFSLLSLLLPCRRRCCELWCSREAVATNARTVLSRPPEASAPAPASRWGRTLRGGFAAAGALDESSDSDSENCISA